MDAEARPRGRVRLSQRMIETLPPPPQDARRREMEYADADAIGLRLSVSKTGRKFFDYRYKYNRRKRFMRIGEWPGMSLQDARQRARDCHNLLYKGIDPATERERRVNVVTFGEFIENEYLPFVRANKKSAQDDANKLKRDVLPLWGKLALSAITTKDVQSLCTRIRTAASPSYGNRYYALIHRIFNLAILWGRLEGRNPAKGVAKAKESAGRERFLDRDELERFLAALDACEDCVSAQAIKFLLFTGMRRGEAITLKWEHVSMERSTVFLPVTKSGRSRTVLVNELAKSILVERQRDRVEGCPWVFPGKRKGTHLLEPRFTFDKVKEQAGIENLRLHDLRHTFASIAVQNGASLYEVQKLLGHSTSAMTQRYSHLSDVSLRAVTDGVASKISHSAG